MSKIWVEGFWKPQPQDDGPAASTPAEPPLGAYAAVVLLSLIILAMGVFPEPVIRHVEQATAGFWTGAPQ
jgi:formate hydrogenlyase subunit 3/multisubunit Na+/H+ antiporter MnhD subunit